MALGACPEARQDAAAEQRREAILRSWRDDTPKPPPLLPADLAWTRTLGATPAAGGAMDLQRVYLPLRNDSILALSRETGATIWTREIRVTTTPAVGDGLVYVASNGALRAVDAENGADRWLTPVEDAVTAPLVWDNGWLLVITESGELLALRAVDGRVIWRRSTDARSSYRVVPSGDGLLYLSLVDGRLVAIAGDTGALLWEQMLPGTISEPAAARDRVFVGSTDNFLYAFDRRGRFEWKWRNGGDVIGVATDRDVIYIASLDNIIRAVNRGNGNQRWQEPTGTRPTFPPRAFGGVIILPGISPTLTAFVGATGTVQGTFAAAGELVGPPLIDPALKPFGVAFVTITREGVVEALRPRAMIFRDPAPVPLGSLPGRPLARERVR